MRIRSVEGMVEVVVERDFDGRGGEQAVGPANRRFVWKSGRLTMGVEKCRGYILY